VSTIEVSNVVADLPWIADANVYGVAVPGMYASNFQIIRHLCLSGLAHRWSHEIV